MLIWMSFCEILDIELHCNILVRDELHCNILVRDYDFGHMIIYHFIYPVDLGIFVLCATLCDWTPCYLSKGCMLVWYICLVMVYDLIFICCMIYLSYASPFIIHTLIAPHGCNNLGGVSYLFWYVQNWHLRPLYEYHSYAHIKGSLS